MSFCQTIPRNEIIFAVILVLALYITFSLIDVDAVTYDEVSEVKDQIKMLKEKNKAYLVQLIQDRAFINAHYEELKQLNNNLSVLKSKPTWDNLDQIESLELEIAQLETKIKNLKSDYDKLKKEKNQSLNILETTKQKHKDLQEQYYLEKRNYLNGLSKVIGVRLDSTCMTLIKAGINNGTCPTYDDLIPLDSSLKEYSGDFVIIDNVTQREKSPYKNAWRYYDFDDNFRVIVDPSQGMIERIKMIEIRPNFDTYLLTHELTQKPEFELVDVQVNNTYSWIKTNKTVDVIVRNQTQDYARILFHDRFIDERCVKAAINAEKYLELLPDTIHHMRSGCSPESTSFITKEIIKPNYTSIDISESRKYQYEKWLNEVKTFCIFKYKSCTS